MQTHTAALETPPDERRFVRPIRPSVEPTIDIRTNAVAPIDSAPKIAIPWRQGSEEIPICASPRVALYPAMVAGAA